MLLGQEAAGDEWSVRWLAFSLNQTKVGPGETDVWDDPEMAATRLAVEVGVAVRDGWPDAFPAVHRALSPPATTGASTSGTTTSSPAS